MAAVKKISRKFTASSVLEMVIAMIVILIIFGIAMAIFTNVTRLSLSRKKLQAEAMINRALLQAGQSSIRTDDSVTTGGFKITMRFKQTASSRLSEVTATAFDENMEKVAEQKRLLINSGE